MPTFEDATRKLYERKLALKEGGDQPVVGALSDIDWEDFTEIDYQETIELNTLATMIILSIIYIPVGFIVASLYPIYIILIYILVHMHIFKDPIYLLLLVFSYFH